MFQYRSGGLPVKIGPSRHLIGQLEWVQVDLARCPVKKGARPRRSCLLTPPLYSLAFTAVPARVECVCTRPGPHRLRANPRRTARRTAVDASLLPYPALYTKGEYRTRHTLANFLRPMHPSQMRIRRSRCARYSRIPAVLLYVPGVTPRPDLTSAGSIIKNSMLSRSCHGLCKP